MKKTEIQLKAALSIILKSNIIVFGLAEKINNLEKENSDLKKKLKTKTIRNNSPD